MPITHTGGNARGTAPGADTRSGGENPRIAGVRRGLGLDMQRVFAAQYHEAIKREVWRTHDFDWVGSEEWEKEIYDLTHGKIGYFANLGAARGAKKQGVMLTDYIDRPQVQAALRDETYKFARAAGRSTVDKLRRSMMRAQEQGDSIPEMVKRIKRVLGFDPEKEVYTPRAEGDRLENWRAERIARTESATATTIGERTQWESSGMVEYCQWLASSDACPFCLAINGEKRGPGEPFFVMGSSLTVPWDGKMITMEFNYRDIMGPPSHPMCRCDLIPVLQRIVGSGRQQ